MDQDNLGEQPAVVGPIVRATDAQITKVSIRVATYVRYAFTGVVGLGCDLAEWVGSLSEFAGKKRFPDEPFLERGGRFDQEPQFGRL